MRRIIRKNLKTNIRPNKGTISKFSLESRGNIHTETKYDSPIDPDITFIEILDSEQSNIRAVVAAREAMVDLNSGRFDYYLDFYL